MVQLVLQVVFLGVHGLILASTALQVGLYVAGVDLGSVESHSSPAEAAGYQFGRLFAFFLGIVWGAGGAGWCAVNGYGIWKHKGWVYDSLRGYWAMIILTLCCFPIGIAAIAHLTRPRVKLAFNVSTPNSEL